jgi:hypothetical protein
MKRHKKSKSKREKAWLYLAEAWALPSGVAVCLLRNYAQSAMQEGIPLLFLGQKLSYFFKCGCIRTTQHGGNV